MADMNCEYGKSYNLTDNTFNRTEYEFQGWSKDKNATTATYENGKSVKNLSSTDGEEVTLYAVWKEAILCYVKDGMMLHYDGKKNTVSGHNSSATTWTDLSGNGRNGSVNGGIWGTNYLQFDGVDDWVGIGQMNYANPTVEVVVSMSGGNSGEEYIIGNIEAGGYGISYNCDSGNKVAFVSFVSGGYKLNYGSEISKNKIYSFSGKFDGSKSYLRENGMFYSMSLSGSIGSSSGGTIMALGTNPTGTSSSGAHLNGKIYSVRVYNRALTEAEVQQNYNIDKTRFNIN